MVGYLANLPHQKQNINRRNMQEEGVLNWEKIVIVLIGIVILASILLILRNRSKINRKRIEREDMLQKDLEQIQNCEKQNP